jgi:23S rRNA pseudouridine2605 synthase
MSRKGEHDGKPGERIAKAMARAGLCSRREAEAWVTAGRVAVNGAVIASPALNVSPTDKVTVDGKPLPQRERTRLFLFHKPRGLVTTTFDPEGRRTIFDALPKDLPRLITVGRLDFNTEGLLLLTNDGGLARVLEHPDTGWLRRYRVRAHGSVTQEQLDTLREGITVDGVHYGPIEAKLDRPQGANIWLTFAIREGKNREVRNVLGALNLDVNRLIRVSFGPFQLTELAEGAVEEVKTRVLREQLGWKIVAQAEIDFDAPVTVRDEPSPERKGKPRHPEARAPEGREPRRTPGHRSPSDSPKPTRADPGGHGRSSFEDRRRAPAGAPSARPGGRSRPDDGQRHKRASQDDGGRYRPASKDDGERYRRPPQDDRESSRRGPPRDDGKKPAKARPWRGRNRDAPIPERDAEAGKQRKTKSGLLTDRKGRRVLVQRVQPEPSAEPPQRPDRPGRPPRGPSRGKPARDRRRGPRPSQPRSTGGDKRK